MRIQWKKILLQLLWFELLAVEPIKLLAKGLYGFKAEMKKRLVAWAIKVAIALLLLALAHCALLFSLGALALYLNTLLGSSYQGFLMVSGGCVALLLLLWMAIRMR